MMRKARVLGALSIVVVVVACGSDDGDSDPSPAEPSTVTATATATATATEVVTTEEPGLTLTEACRSVGAALPRKGFFPPGYGDEWVDFSTAVAQIYTEAGDEAQQALQPFYDKVLELSHSGAGDAMPGVNKIIKLSNQFTRSLGQLENACIF